MTNSDILPGNVPRWRGWAIPGSTVPGPNLADLTSIPEDQSLDALSGHFKIFQYKKGHRFSTDDLLVAWYGTSHAPSASRVLDLGSGIGSVGMTAAWRLPGAQFVTVEAQAISVELSKKSARYNGIESRYEIRTGDFRQPEVLDTSEKFDLVLGSPPYFPMDHGIHGDHEQKIACRFELRGNISDYCAVASQHLAPGGVFAVVFPIQPAHQEQRVLESAQEAGLSILRRRNIVLKEGAPPLLGLFLMTKSEDLPERYRNAGWQEPDLIIRHRDGTTHPEYSAVKMSIGFPP